MRFSPDMRRLSWLVSRPIAHRGLHNSARGVLENTSSAFAAAIKHGYAIECDLQLSKDGEAIVFHDWTLDRLTEVSGPVENRTVAALKAVPFKITDDRVQTLAEFLQQVHGRVPLVIEIKSRWTGDERLTIRALKILEHYAGPYCLMSFDPDVIAVVKREAPATIRGIVADRVIDDGYRKLPVSQRLDLRNLTHLARTQPDFISFYWRDLPWTPVNQFRQAGCPVLTWTIRSPEAATLARRYCDQITFEGFFP